MSGIATRLVIAAALVSGAASAQTPDDPVKVGVPRGSLVAAGGGAPADVLARFIALAGGPDALIVSIPPSPTCVLAGGAQVAGDGCSTAGMVAGRPGAPRPVAQTLAEGTAAQFRAAGARNVTVIETYNRAMADSESFVAPITRASGFWAPGGVPQKLMDVYGGTRTERELRNLLARGGVVGGTSAGAVILGSHFGFPAAVDDDSRLTPGFGFLRNVRLMPHASSQGALPMLAILAASHPERVLLAMDERAAWEIHGDTAEVIGTGSAFVPGEDPATPDRRYLTLRAADRYNMATRVVTRATR